MKPAGSNTTPTDSHDIADEFLRIRRETEDICAPLSIEDYVVQPVVDVSPPKWHLGHTTWFFETFVLKPHSKKYREFNPEYNFVFNSYYETVGARVIRTDRGNLSRPTVKDIYRYRNHVNEGILKLLQTDVSGFADVIWLGLHHEQQHQELLLTDIKYILGNNPLFPVYSDTTLEKTEPADSEDITVKAGMYPIGYRGNAFCFDNELAAHEVYLPAFRMSGKLINNASYMEFMADKGYSDFRYWHSEGWEWVNREKIAAPLYWHKIDGRWMYYTLNGMREVDKTQPLCHISFYEASAFAAWKGRRLPTEFEWEAASGLLAPSGRWEWTGSAYLPYPGYQKAGGAIGEYNGKFMVNQMVLRGGSVATPAGHSRSSYRNFFHPHLRWQYTGIRLCDSL